MQKQYLPKAFYICSEPLEQIVPDDQTSVDDVIECVDDTLDEITAEIYLRIGPDKDDLGEC